MNADIDAVIQHALHIGERGNIVKRYKEAEDAVRTGVNLDLPVYCDASHVQQALENHLDELNTTPVEVSMVRKGGEFIISESHDGRTLRMDETVQAVVDALNTHDWTQTEAVAEMCVDVTPAIHTTEELEVVKDLLGSYSTSYYGSSNNRIANIETGAAKIDNYVLWPGECFSFLSMTVPFTEDNGYRMAGTYAGGKSVDGMGGGICQVSSTLYNAVLRAELTIVNRVNHMMTVGYVPISADATIANPDTDFVSEMIMNILYFWKFMLMVAVCMPMFTAWKPDRQTERLILSVLQSRRLSLEMMSLHMTGQNRPGIQRSRKMHTQDMWLLYISMYMLMVCRQKKFW